MARKSNGNSQRFYVFVLMPFDQSFNDIYRIGIKQTCESIGFRAERVDEQIFHNEGMLHRIYGQIRAADILIADMSGKNPNVFYEVGYAHALEKKCILITDNAADIPFDLKQHRHIIYGNSILTLKERLILDLKSIKKELFDNKPAVTIEKREAVYSLRKSNYKTDVKIEIIFDIFNKSLLAPAEILSIHLYTSEGWRFNFDLRECPNTTSDHGNFKLRHSIGLTPQRLQKGTGWVQIKVLGEKTVDKKLNKLPTLIKFDLDEELMVKIHLSDKEIISIFPLKSEVKEFPKPSN